MLRVTRTDVVLTLLSATVEMAVVVWAIRRWMRTS